ncbi:MAG: hypothetical protein ACK6EB_07895 [Planctomyces sp.]|jgi:hypothetical protein
MTGWHWLFGGEVYYPSGGMNDLLGIYPIELMVCAHAVDHAVAILQEGQQ